MIDARKLCILSLIVLGCVALCFFASRSIRRHSSPPSKNAPSKTCVSGGSALAGRSSTPSLPRLGKNKLNSTRNQSATGEDLFSPEERETGEAVEISDMSSRNEVSEADFHIELDDDDNPILNEDGEPARSLNARLGAGGGNG